MESPLKFFAKTSALFVVLLAVVGFNIGVWGLQRHPTAPSLYVADANPERGRVLIHDFGCGACHVVPGVHGAAGKVGPRLDRVKELVYIAGVLPNTPENMIHWIADPKDADPRTAMPDLGVEEHDARDIAAYLYDIP